MLDDYAMEGRRRIMARNFDLLTRFAGNAAKTAIVIGALFVTGCSATTSGTSSSNAPLETTVSQPSRQQAPDVDAVRPADVINRAKGHVTRSGEVYLMRGLANVFSRGIDSMAEDMRAKGIDASNFSYKHWEPIARDIVARAKDNEVSYPIVIIGHSLGGNESSKFANYLASRGVRVELVVTFDPVETGRVGANIGKVVNYYLPMETKDNRVLPAGDFNGKLENIDVTSDASITHTNVEKNARFQAATIKSVMALGKAI